MSTLKGEASYLYTALGHPLRREIIRILGSKKEATFTELKTSLGASVGTLYYNLDLLEGFIAQDESKRYILTRQGERAYTFLLESEEKVISLGIEAEMRKGWLGRLSKWVMAWDLFTLIQKSPRMFLPSSIVILLCGSWITYQAQLLPIVFLYSDKLVNPPILVPILFLLGVALVNILGNIFPAIFYHRPPLEGAESLLVASCFAALPSLLLPTIWFAYKAMSISPNVVIAQVVMLVMMGFSLSFITTAVSTAKGLRVEKAAIITIVLLYLMIGFALFTYRF